ncbi:restriction endonuclease subunit S [Globicatella sanguinis]
MEWIELGKLANIEIGKTPARKNSKYWKGDYTWVSIADMKDKYISDSREKISKLALKETNIKIVPKGTVIMSFKLSIGKRAITEKDLYTNEAIAAFHIKDGNILEANYLYYVLGFIDLTRDTDRAVMGKTLNKSKLSRIKIPVPPMETQEKIVQALDQAQALIDKRKEQIEALDQLIESIFYTMFGDPVRNEKGWAVKKLGTTTEIITGNTPPRKDAENYGNYIEWIKSDNINTPYTYITEAKEYLSKIGKEKGRYVPKNSILMTCIAGSLNCIGNVAITDREVAYNQQINGFIPKEYSLYFLYSLFSFSKEFIQNNSTSSMKGMISKGTLSDLEYIVPPLSLQKEFAQKVEVIEKQKEVLEESLELMEENYKSIMDKAFKGQLFN